MKGQCLASAVVAVLALSAGRGDASGETKPWTLGASAQAQRPSAIDWGGRYPFDGPGGTSFFDLPWVKPKLIALVGGKLYRDTLRAWNAAVPVLTEANDLLVQGCDPADCSRNVAVLIESNMVMVCIFDGVRLTWHVAPTAPLLIRASEGVKDSGCAFRSLAQARAQLLLLQRRKASAGRRRRFARRAAPPGRGRRGI